MKELITDTSDSRHVELESLTKTIETSLLAGRAAPISDELSERLFHLTLNGNDREPVV